MEKKIKIEIDLNPVEIENNRKIIDLFANGIGAMELNEIAPLLDEKGDYNGMSKIEFLEWLSNKFNECQDNNIFYLHVKLRYCSNCKPGNATLVFNHGSFPKDEDGFNLKKGFMLDIKNGLIVDIGICYGWLNEKELYHCISNN